MKRLLPGSCWPWRAQRQQFSAESRRCLLWIVEGVHDIEFLRGISGVLRSADPSVLDVAACERQGRLIFVPFGGSRLPAWATKFAPLGVPELHLYDREQPPESTLRHAVAAQVNARRGCRAFVTSRPCLESYLHPEAIWRAGGIRIASEPQVDLVVATAQALTAADETALPWNQRSPRQRRRIRNRLKDWLNRVAVQQMTPDLLAERDPQQEVATWFCTAADLLASPP